MPKIPGYSPDMNCVFLDRQKVGCIVVGIYSLNLHNAYLCPGQVLSIKRDARYLESLAIYSAIESISSKAEGAHITFAIFQTAFLHPNEIRPYRFEFLFHHEQI